ncbi:MAG: hypothetical protein SFV54_13370 [Bryobacteraceae bacterium]|nr:hypothetical protein [Bryobacteraceae bacterium]
MFTVCRFALLELTLSLAASAANLPLGPLYYDPFFGIGQATVVLQNLSGTCDPNGIQVCGFVSDPETAPSVQGTLTIGTAGGNFLINVPLTAPGLTFEYEVNPETFLFASFTGVIPAGEPYVVTTPNGNIVASSYLLASDTITPDTPNGLFFVDLPDGGGEIPEPASLFLTGGALLIAAAASRLLTRNRS